MTSQRCWQYAFHTNCANILRKLTCAKERKRHRANAFWPNLGCWASKGLQGAYMGVGALFRLRKLIVLMAHPEKLKLPTTWLQIIRDRNLNVRFSRKRTFNRPEYQQNEGPLTANSGRRLSTVMSRYFAIAQSQKPRCVVVQNILLLRLGKKFRVENCPNSLSICAQTNV